MEIVALLLGWASALTFVALSGKSKPKDLKPVPVRVPARLPNKSVLRQMTRQR